MTDTQKTQLNPETSVEFKRVDSETIVIATTQTFKGAQAEALVSKMIGDIDQYEQNIKNLEKQRDGVKEFLAKVTSDVK